MTVQRISPWPSPSIRPVLDINMPIMDGIDVAIAIRAALPETLPVLIGLTGNPVNLMPERARLAFDYLLLKPPDFEALAASLWPP